MIELTELGQMNNRVSPLAARGVVRLAKNGVQTGRGVFRKRYGITTSVTVNLQIGVTGPFRPFIWKPASTAYVILVGADGLAFVNPWNGYLYTRGHDETHDLDYASGAIWSTVGATPDVATAWGLTAPTTADQMDLHTDDSDLEGGSYAYIACSRHTLRNVLSPALRLKSKTADKVSENLQWIGGPGSSIDIPALGGVPTGCCAWFFRTRLQRATAAADYVPERTSDLNHLRFIAEKTATVGVVATWRDLGGQPRAGLFDYATDVVPSSTISAYFDGCWFYASGMKLYHSNPACPETYAGNDYCTLAEVGEDLIQGRAILAVPPDCGNIVALAPRGGTLLVLCQYGAWRVVPGGSLGLYSVEPDHFWVDCVSKVTLAPSPEGWWWLSAEGVVLWRGGESAPQVLTRGAIDPADADTLFAADLSGAFGAYDVAERQYVVIVPKSGGGQFGLTVRGDRLPDELVVGQWTFGASLAAITGLGYDPINRRLIWVFGSGETPATAKCETAGTYSEGTGPDTYDFEIEPWWGEAGGGEPETKRSGCLRLFIHRADATHTQTVTVQMQSLETTEEPALPASTALTWASGQAHPKHTSAAPIRGRMVKCRLVNRDAYNLEFRAVQIGTHDEILAAAGVKT